MAVGLPQSLTAEIQGSSTAMAPQVRDRCSRRSSRHSLGGCPRSSSTALPTVRRICPLLPASAPRFSILTTSDDSHVESARVSPLKPHNRFSRWCTNEIPTNRPGIVDGAVGGGSRLAAGDTCVDRERGRGVERRGPRGSPSFHDWSACDRPCPGDRAQCVSMMPGRRSIRLPLACNFVQTRSGYRRRPVTRDQLRRIRRAGEPVSGTTAVVRWHHGAARLRPGRWVGPGQPARSGRRTGGARCPGNRWREQSGGYADYTGYTPVNTPTSCSIRTDGSRWCS